MNDIDAINLLNNKINNKKNNYKILEDCIHNLYIEELYINKSRLSTGNSYIINNHDNTNDKRLDVNINLNSGGYQWLIEIYNPGKDICITNNKGEALIKLSINSNYFCLENNKYVKKMIKNEFKLNYSDIFKDGIEVSNLNNQAILKSLKFLRIGYKTDIHSNLNIHYSKNLKLFTDYINCLNKLLLSTTIIDLYIYNNCKWSKIDTFGTDLTCCANNNIHYKYSVLNLLDNKTYSLTRKVSSKKPMCCFNKDDWKAYNNVKGKFGQIGDPHIATINGEHYDFNHIGYLRYFNNENLIINVKTDHGDYENWANNDYIRQVYIRYNNNYCLVDTGFRGKPVKILINNNFNIKEEKLEFNKKALRYAGYSNFKSNNEQKINDYLNNSPFDVVPKLIRNKITFYINENFDLEIVNVNQYNLQPCRLFLNIKNKMNSSNWKGLVVDRKWAYSSILESIYDISDIKLISNKIPNLTTPSKLLNKTWE